ncbi:hypothetical protein B0T20DRAFT_400268 [Sordaria brevicollis]|uniref:J domain-containing protein n=1 Tax=Sordaria brevicollis TaxID=83679 RepID=A0AAE0UGR7_SORBR|nr:hypothetical protein B0T20DRAFT_400268 [Sordaria brevicollis]
MSDLLSLFGWTFLPNLVTGWVQSLYYGITIRAGSPHPIPGTPRYAEHRRRIHILVVTIYLLYTMYEAHYELVVRGSNFYGDLGVSPDASEREIKSRFRRLAALYHPDKVTGQQNQEEVNNYFVHLKTAVDTLTDPVRRWAYERFGLDAVAWAGPQGNGAKGACKTHRDFVMRGAQMLLSYYGLAAAVLYALGLLGYLTWGKYERWLVLASMFVWEAHTVMSPWRPVVFQHFLNPLLQRVTGIMGRYYLPFQAVALMRKLSVTVYIAISQIGPLLTADTSSGQLVAKDSNGAGADQEELLKQGLERLEMMSRGLDQDMSRLVELELAPFAGDQEALSSMRGKIKEWLVQNTIRNDPMVRDALGRGLQRRRVDAPAGARGTK